MLKGFRGMLEGKTSLHHSLWIFLIKTYREREVVSLGSLPRTKYIVPKCSRGVSMDDPLIYIRVRVSNKFCMTTHIHNTKKHNLYVNLLGLIGNQIKKSRWYPHIFSCSTKPSTSIT
jgi:hypothetical protein